MRAAQHDDLEHSYSQLLAHPPHHFSLTKFFPTIFRKGICAEGVFGYNTNMASGKPPFAKGGIMELIHESTGKKLYRDGNRLIKSFDETMFSKADILNEALNQARVEATSLHIPKVLEVSVIGGKWSLTWEFIEGETLEELMQKHLEKLDEYLEFFVDLQIRMSKEKVPLLGHLRDKMHAKISASSFPATVRYDLHVRLDGLPRHKKLCHGDFQPSNVIITKDGTPYIIDWSHATQGNGSADAARTYLIFKLQGKDKLAEQYLKLYCEKTETAIHYVQRILPIVACSQSVKKKPEEQEFLAKWVNVVDWS